MLNITKEQFLKIYHDTKLIDYVDLFYTKPQTDTELLNIYLPSKLWRLNNLYTIVDKFGKTIKFKMNLSQHKVYAASLRHSRIIILKSRQQGISTLWLVSFFDDAITNPNFNIGLMAQGTDEATTLLTRVKSLWEHLDQDIKSYLGVAINKDNTKEFSISTFDGQKVSYANIFIRTSFRSATLHRLHISEMGKIANKYPEKATETKTGTLQAIAPGNIAVIESTAEGDNLFKDMWDNSVKYSDQLSGQDFYPVFLSWLDDPDCNEERDQQVSTRHADYFTLLEKAIGYELTTTQKNFWIVKHRELGEKIYQEYPSTPIEAFMATKQGTYYAKQYMTSVKERNREKADLYDPNLDVQVAFDLGMNDTMSGGVFQTFGREVRVFDEIYDSGQKISYYTDILKKKPYYDHITHIILPHDAEVTDLTSGETRKQAFEKEMPHVIITVLPRTDRMDGIEATRTMLLDFWLDPICEYIKECIFNYTKEWDEKHNRWKNTPLHDEYSNGADMLRYMAMGRMDGTIRGPKFRKRTGGFDV